MMQKLGAVTLAAMAASLMMGSGALACDLEETAPVVMTPSGFDEINPGRINPGQRATLNQQRRQCEWRTRQRVQVPRGCGIRGVTITGDGPKPERIDIERLIDDTVSAQRTPMGANGSWTVSVNAPLLCSSGGCLGSRYEVRSTNEMPIVSGCIEQSLEIVLRLFEP